MATMGTSTASQIARKVSLGICSTSVLVLELDGNSSYRNYIIDAMYRLTPAALEKGAKYEVR